MSILLGQNSGDIFDVDNEKYGRQTKIKEGARVVGVENGGREWQQQCIENIVTNFL